MAFWDDEQTTLRKAWEVLNRSNVTYDVDSNSYEVTGGDRQRLGRKTCEAFDALRDKGFLEVVDRGHVEQTRAGIAWYYA